MQLPQPRVALDLRPRREREQHQTAQQNARPVVGAPEPGAEWIVGETPDLGLTAQAQDSGPAEQRKTRPPDRPVHPQQSRQGHQGPGRHQQQEPVAAGAAAEVRTGLQIGLGERIDDGNQHRHDHPNRQPKAMVGVLLRHRFGLLGDAQALLAHQQAQTNRRPHQGIDEQDHQHRMEQGKPVNGAHGNSSSRAEPWANPDGSATVKSRAARPPGSNRPGLRADQASPPAGQTGCRRADRDAPGAVAPSASGGPI